MGHGEELFDIITIGMENSRSSRQLLSGTYLVLRPNGVFIGEIKQTTVGLSPLGAEYEKHQQGALVEFVKKQ